MAEPIHYTSFPGFDGTSLEDSFVLEIQATPGRLNITLDLMIGWAHPSYRDPLEGEVACFRKAVIEFPAVQELTWTRQSSIRPAVDAIGEQDWGGIDALRQLGTVYQLEGDWGAIEVASQEPIVRIIGS
ncbi:hypothetical protein QF035_004646 [Streptomyces umbrinus]|uniref:Uncharacterized protein n=1 Tax=Streptomyces umbrinus TaxID=67370 RepID=A0ABU0SU33_9ACTN|nr:hypothetical protein [Streptomyces umbrinus]MDQ1027064.1 hypothetical protein [Streptomyces umbrinus]